MILEAMRHTCVWVQPEILGSLAMQRKGHLCVGVHVRITGRDLEDGMARGCVFPDMTTVEKLGAEGHTEVKKGVGGWL